MKIKKFFIIPILLLMVTGVYVLINLLPKNVEAASDSSSTSDLQLMARAINGEARDAMNGWDPTGGAIYYFNPSTATNKWIWSRPLIKTIGKHRFCK